MLFIPAVDFLLYVYNFRLDRFVPNGLSISFEHFLEVTLFVHTSKYTVNLSNSVIFKTRSNIISSNFLTIFKPRSHNRYVYACVCKKQVLVSY